MSKYSSEFKKQVVLEYLEGQGGTIYLAKLHGIPNHAQIQRWVAAYKQYGDSGLMRSRRQKIYSFEQKLSVVELYLTSELSYQELALQEGIYNPTLIAKWVNDFRMVGPDALRAKKKGRKKALNTPNKKTSISSVKAIPVDTSVEYVKQLEDELLKLRIENAYLKELMRLRLEEEALLRKQRESSTASEENLN